MSAAALNAMEIDQVMVRVIFETADGSRVVTQAASGTSAMRAAVEADVPGIEASCGGACSCATCHVEVMGGWFAKVGPASTIEGEMIEFEGEPRPTSRLSCQIQLTNALDGLELRVVPRS